MIIRPLRCRCRCRRGRCNTRPHLSDREAPFGKLCVFTSINYIQLMEYSGGNADRDSFRDPED